MSSANVVFISYNSTLTGSKALRALNNNFTIQSNLYKGSNNMMKTYCKYYDNAKKNEPYYDVLASQISMLNQDIFDRYFTYKPVNLIETGTNENNFHPSQEDPLVFKMKSKNLNGFETVTREFMENNLNYSDSNTKHIYIYGPIADLVLSNVMSQIKYTIKNNEKLFIHFQGENILDNLGNDGDTIFGMESKGNLFKNAFNYQNSMKNARILRNFIQENSNCESFTIISNITPELCVNKVNNEELKFPLNNEGNIIKNGLPKIYLTFYEDIKNLINGTFKSSYYLKLNVFDIYQDMVDKDNMTSVMFLLINTIDTKYLKLYLIGRESFRLTYNNEIISHYQSMNFSLLPDIIKPNIEELHKNIELDMKYTTDYYWPKFKNSNYDLVYDNDITINHYMLFCKCFTIILNKMNSFYNIKFNNYICTNSLIANPSSDEKKRPLLNEILFYPSLNSYICSINNIDSVYFQENTVFKNIKKSTDYVSDTELIFN